MKNQQDLSTLTSEELDKRAKTTKTAAILLAVIIGIQFFVGLFLTIKQGFNVFIVIPFAFLPLMIINFVNVKKINEETAKRNS
jgi:hypothetical protein